MATEALNRVTVYLAGPVSNCNEEQVTRWRHRVKELLDSSTYECIDPAMKRGTWNPQDEIVDIDRSDVVIANLWKESVGTVVGVIQARRRGKPVILIDQNFIESKVLNTFVGKLRVRSVDAAIQMLNNEVKHMLSQEIVVVKRERPIEKFSLLKLQNAINRGCTDAKIDDMLFPIKVAQLTYSSIKNEIKTDRKTKTAQVSTEQIREFLASNLRLISLDGNYPAELRSYALKLHAKWASQEQIKQRKRNIEELANENASLKSIQSDLEERCRLLEGMQLDSSRIELEAAADAPRVETILEVLLSLQQTHGRFMVIHEQVLKSASDCEYRFPTRIYNSLLCLAEYARNLQYGMRPGDLKKWFDSHEVSCDYATTESKSTRNDPGMRLERTVTYEGKKEVLLKHLKFAHVRLHFGFLGNNRVLIGHLGQHKSISTEG